MDFPQLCMVHFHFPLGHEHSIIYILKLEVHIERLLEVEMDSQTSTDIYFGKADIKTTALVER